MAGFSHAQADGLRKIMSKKDKTRVLADYYEKFKSGARKKGVAPKDIQRVWDMITSFSGYSFCKPHSASYARVSFQAAYLKTHYPAEFMAAVISNQGGFYSTFAYVSEAKRLNITVLNPDVNQSGIQWKGNNLKLRVGLQAIKNLSAITMQRIIVERNKNPFTSLGDFFNRVGPREDEIRALVHTGSLDSLDPNGNRPAKLWAFAAWQKCRQKHKGEPSLFDRISQTIPIPDLPPQNPIDKFRREFSSLGFLCACHPIVLYEDVVRRHNTVKAGQLSGHIGKNITFAGWLITGKIVKTKKGNPMKFLTFEDETGIVETVFFPKPYAQFCHMLDYGRPYLLKGVVDLNWGAVTLAVNHTVLLWPDKPRNMQ